MRAAVLALVALAGCKAGAPAPAPTPPALTGRVVDRADVLDAATEATITEVSQALEQRTGHQLVVATVPSLNGTPIADYSRTLFGGWKIGRECCDDGVGLLVAPNEKQVRIEVGRGLTGSFTDAEAKAIVDELLLPSFKSGRMQDGIERGADAIAAAVS